MATDRETIVLIPNEMLKVIPSFGGDKRQLNLFIRQCEFVISKYAGSTAQNAYVMHSIMGKLVDKAAALISEREDISTWDEFKDILTQHFGDPRSEESIAIELETMKIRTGETYLDFCNRIQSVRSTLLSKVNLLGDQNLKQSKVTIYNHTSLSVFLYNLSEDIARVVRLGKPKTLEAALSIVMEEVDFHNQHVAHNKFTNNRSHTSLQPSVAQPTFKFGNSAQPLTQFKFGVPNQTQGQFRPPQPSGYRPQLGYRPPFYTQPQGMRPQQFGFRPQQFGARPQFGMHPQQFSMRPHQFGMRPQNPGNTQFGYKPPAPTNYQANTSQDVTMRTAIPMKTQQPGFRLNELEFDEAADYNEYYDYETDVQNYENYYSNDYSENPVETDVQEKDDGKAVISDASGEIQNFRVGLKTNHSR